MSKRYSFLLLVAALGLILAACGGAPAAGNVDETGGAASSSAEIGATSVAVADVAPAVRLNDDYDDALSVTEQLASGTLQLEETELALSETQAADLLPLWQALQSLINSDNAAQAELDAVVNQLQETMTPDQVQAIREMRLTQAGLTEMMQSGELAIGGFGGRAGQGNDENSEGFRGGFGAIGGPGSGPGGGPGGGFAGGGPGGGFAGVPPADLNEDDLATRQAQFAEGDFSALQEQALIRAVVRLMEVKTGQALDQAPGSLVNTVFTVVSEATGISLESLREQVAEGATLAQIVEDNGGHIQAVRVSLVEALQALPNAENFDAEQLADDWLGMRP